VPPFGDALARLEAAAARGDVAFIYRAALAESKYHAGSYLGTLLNACATSLETSVEDERAEA